MSRASRRAWEFLGFYLRVAEIGRGGTRLKTWWANEAFPISQRGARARGRACSAGQLLAVPAGASVPPRGPSASLAPTQSRSSPSPRLSPQPVRIVHSHAQQNRNKGAHKDSALSLQVQKLKLSLPYFTDAIPQDIGNGY